MTTNTLGLRMRTLPIAAASPRLMELCDEVGQGPNVVLIENGDRERAALMSASEMEGLIATVELLRHPASAVRVFDAMERTGRGEGTRLTMTELAAWAQAANSGGARLSQ